MGGICGFIKLQSRTTCFSQEYLEAINMTMIKRGSDSQKVWLDEKNRVGLGNCRLAILDLSSNAEQPMTNQDGSIVLTFNGEIYNHLELRQRLMRTGKYNWKTNHSDTEVILHAYEEWGEACLQYFRGMFAFALWDANKEKLWLVRDRFGIKPLYYMEKNGVLVFASSVKALLKVMTRKPSIDEKSISDYLSFLCTPAEDTLFKDIKKVRPAHYMNVFYGHSKIEKKKYWDVLDNLRDDIYYAAEEEIVELLRDELQSVMKLYESSDVQIGVFLSGGVDSSTNAVLFSRDSSYPVPTFSVGYDKKYTECSSELEYARLVAQQIKAAHHEFIIDEEKTLQYLKTLIAVQGEPLADPVSIPLYYMSKMAKDSKVSVCYCGEGADEILAGYANKNEYLTQTLSAKIRKVPFTGILLAKWLELSGEKYRFRYECVRRALHKMPAFWSGHEGFYYHDKRMIMSDDYNNKYDNYDSFEKIKDTYMFFQNHAKEVSPRNWMTYAELNHRLPELILARTDLMTMEAGVECRFPFLDHKLVELCLSIPTKLKNKNRVPKYLLKESMRNIVPEAVLNRKKQGFGLPVNDWVNCELGKIIDEKIAKFANVSGYLNKNYLKNDKYGIVQLGRKWILYNLAAWWEKNIYE